MPDNPNRELWHTMFAVGHPALRAQQGFHRRLPSPPRCRLCYVPFGGVGGLYMRFRGKRPSNRNSRYCSACDKFIRNFPGGAEVELSMLFVDVRGSTPLAERMSPSDFGSVMNRFYVTVSTALNETEGFVIYRGDDRVQGVYPPGFSGPDHVRLAVRAAEGLLRLELPAAPDGSTMQIGAGVHTGVVYIGTISGAEPGIGDVGVLGDNANVAARLSAAARPGEVLVSDAACAAGGLDLSHLEHRPLELKGKSVPISVRVMCRGGGVQAVRPQPSLS